MTTSVSGYGGSVFTWSVSDGAGEVRITRDQWVGPLYLVSGEGDQSLDEKLAVFLW